MKKKILKKISVLSLAIMLMLAVLPASAATSDYKTSWNGITYYHDASVAKGKSILPGIDVSQYQGDINWSKVASSGIKFTFIRLGYTSQYNQSVNLDPKFKTNITNAKAAGIKVGVYYRSQARSTSEAKSEANFVVQQLKSYSLDLPVAVDYEYYDGGTVSRSYPDKATKTAALNAFCDTVSAAGYKAVTYLNTDILQNDVNAGDLKYGLWLARWATGAPGYSGNYEFWQCSGGTSYVNGISGVVDLDWWYADMTDIVKMNRKWVYTVNGTPDYSYTGVAKNANGWWYVKNGVVDFNYTGFAKNDNGKWYCVNGKVSFNIDGIIKDKNGGIGSKNNWYYVVDSKVQTEFTGLSNFSNENGWWYVKKGQVDFSHNGVDKNKNGWWYVTEGKVQFSFTGLANYKNENGWWYIKKGKVDFTHAGVDKNKNGWWYVSGGKVDFNHNGVDKNNNGWWYVTEGGVNFGYTGVADYKNKNGWWYIRNGKVDFSFTGRASNKNGIWNVVNGKVMF